jgi:hypothetical protein
MKAVIIVLALFATLSSCQSKSTDADSSAKAETTENNGVSFHGLWVTQKYVESLMATKSPIIAQGSEVFLKFPATTGDSVAMYTYHEGLDIFHIVKKGTIFYLKNANDSTAIKVSEDGSSMVAFGMKYVKMKDDSGLAEALLFKGTYSNDKITVTFEANGEVKGLNDSRFYLVENDYFSGGDKLNIVYIGSNSDKRDNRPYIFQFNGDTLLIYNTNCAGPSSNCDVLKKESLKWKLVKK